MKATKINTLFDADSGENRLEKIYAQLKDLEQMKDEIMDDLDDFMSQVDNNEHIQKPEQFDDVVDLVVQENREQALQLLDISESGATPEEI